MPTTHSILQGGTELTFEEIKNIDKGPDCLEYEDALIQCHEYRANGQLYCYIIVLSAYLKKFDEKYGTDMRLADSIIPLFYPPDKWEEGDDFWEELYGYEDGVTMSFFRTARKYGFEECVYDWAEFDTDLEEGENAKDVITQIFLNQIEDKDDVWVGIIQDCLSDLRDAVSYLSPGTVVILRNHSIGLYRLICQKYGSSLKNCLEEEMREIDKAIERLSSPILYYYTSKNNYIDDYYYLCFSIGFNGYYTCSFLHLNISWMVNCFILDQLFKDFRKKAANIVALEEKRRGA